ncbi:MAG TPA: D-2-hydroxyacid dehydrogenase family protein [Candidatus Binatia bacterium]|jgi:D-3-phosphoglycerate dehydrogenase|nr:D-2-hydroxyacid dehydrogenase family protein [Candidatus Binatia bacterium]
MKIAIIDDYQNAFKTLKCFPKLSGHEVVIYTDPETSLEKIAERLKDVDAVLLTQQRTGFPRALIEKLPKLKLIGQTGRAATHVDLQACTEKGIVVSAGGSGNPNATAELTWSLILSALRNLPFEVRRLKEGHWQSTLGIGVNGKTVGIYAYGKIGSIVAAAGKAFGARVVCWGREGSTGRAKAAGFEVAKSREDFFAEADILSLHLPLNKDTRGIVMGDDLARMKPTALIVNASRSGLIVKGALEEALKSGRPGRAAVDVYDQEPVLGADHPLLKMNNVTCTPHLGYVTRESYEEYYAVVVDDILAFTAGKPNHVLNPEAIGKR